MTRKTILRWVQEGLLKSFALPSGHNRIEPEEVTRFLKQHNMPVPAELGGEKRRSLLICEDEMQIRRVMSDLLKKHFDITEAENGVEACIKLGQKQPDIMTLDIRMPKMDGLALCRQIRSDPNLRHMKIIIVSAHIDRDHEEEITELSDAIIRKPFSPAELVRACLDIAGVQVPVGE
ncbi:MAG: response regulator [Planctomycetes bacterium]|nr:response regulator [Planctomycetota bacterium]